MKKVLSRIVMFIIIAICSYSCIKKAKLQPADQLTGEWSFLVGTWNWTSSDHNFGWCDNDDYFEVLDSISQGATYSIKFDEEGLIRFFRGDRILKESKIIFHYLNEDDPNDLIFNTYLDGNINHPFGGGGNDTLMNFVAFPFIEETGCGLYKNNFEKE